MTAITLPEPVITIPGSAYRDEVGRSRKATFYLDPAPTQPGEKARAVQLFVSHYKDRKCFSASLTPVTIERGENFTSEGFMLFSGATIKRQPVARFSKAALEAFLAETLAELPEKIAEYPALAAMFADHETASERVL